MEQRRNERVGKWEILEKIARHVSQTWKSGNFSVENGTRLAYYTTAAPRMFRSLLTLQERNFAVLSEIRSLGAAVTERLPRSPPTKADRVQSPAWSPDFRMWESCQTMPLVGRFTRGSPVSPPFYSSAAPYTPQSSSSALKTLLGLPGGRRKAATTCSVVQPQREAATVSRSGGEHQQAASGSRDRLWLSLLPSGSRQSRPGSDILYALYFRCFLTSQSPCQLQKYYGAMASLVIGAELCPRLVCQRSAAQTCCAGCSKSQAPSGDPALQYMSAQITSAQASFLSLLHSNDYCYGKEAQATRQAAKGDISTDTCVLSTTDPTHTGYFNGCGRISYAVVMLELRLMAVTLRNSCQENIDVQNILKQSQCLSHLASIIYSEAQASVPHYLMPRPGCPRPTTRARITCYRLSENVRVRITTTPLLPGFSHVGIVPDDAARCWIFPGFSRFPPSIPALLHSHLASPTSALKTSMLRAAQIYSLTLVRIFRGPQDQTPKLVQAGTCTAPTLAVKPVYNRHYLNGIAMQDHGTLIYKACVLLCVAHLHRTNERRACGKPSSDMIAGRENEGMSEAGGKSATASIRAVKSATGRLDCWTGCVSERQMMTTDKLNVTALKIKVLRAGEGEVRHGESPKCKAGRNGRTQRKPAGQRHRPTRFPGAENPEATPWGLEPSSPWCDVSSVATEPAAVVGLCIMKRSVARQEEADRDIAGSCWAEVARAKEQLPPHVLCSSSSKCISHASVGYLPLACTYLLSVCAWARPLHELKGSRQGEPFSIPFGVAPGCKNRAGRCRRDFLRGLPFPPPFHSGAALYSPRITLIGSGDLNFESRPNNFTRPKLKVK
ncbi:hypothetical protein PR048_003885 [Dryococelus australis]|uniref:Uncharacterized protein n=1 Tax=Dryococelus australis TaxID=614101 RepID=A0ABQ9IQE6_9NEOP|nr:hypothetical protein PR048_003885 [Dryococelus australis]